MNINELLWKYVYSEFNSYKLTIYPLSNKHLKKDNYNMGKVNYNCLL